MCTALVAQHQLQLASGGVIYQFDTYLRTVQDSNTLKSTRFLTFAVYHLKVKSFHKRDINL